MLKNTLNIIHKYIAIAEIYFLTKDIENIERTKAWQNKDKEIQQHAKTIHKSIKKVYDEIGNTLKKRIQKHIKTKADADPITEEEKKDLIASIDFDLQDMADKVLSESKDDYDDMIKEAIKKAIAETNIKIDNVTLDIDDMTKKIISDMTDKITTEPLKDYKDILKSIIETESKAGNTQEEVAHTIFNSIDPVSDWKSLQVAQTTTGSMYNNAQIGTWKDMQSKKILSKKAKKEWLSQRNADTRPSHYGVDGQQRDIDKEFDVMGFGKTPGCKMMHPLDPNCNVAGQVVNCQCTQRIINVK